MEYLNTVILFHQRLGCHDEDATLVERSEKILYFYPNSWDLEKKLYQIDTIEAYQQLIGQYSDEPCCTVQLKNETCTLAEVEPGLWFVITRTSTPPEMTSQRSSASKQLTSRIGQAVSSLIPSTANSQTANVNQKSSLAHATSSSSSEDVPFERRVLSTEELTSCLPHHILDELYNMVNFLIGDINPVIFESEVMEEIKSVRKKIRKLDNLRNKLKNDEQHATEDETIKLSLQGSLELKLENLSKISPAVKIREKLKPIMRVLLPSIDFAMLSSLHSVGFMNTLPLDQPSFLSAQYFTQLCFSKFPGILQSCALYYCENLVWSDVPDLLLGKLARVMRLWRDVSAFEQDPNAIPHAHELWQNKNATSPRGNNLHTSNYDRASMIFENYINFAAYLGTSNPIDSQVLFDTTEDKVFSPIIHHDSKQHRLVVFVQGNIRMLLILKCTDSSSKEPMEVVSFRTRFRSFASAETPRLSAALYKSFVSVTTKSKSSTGAIRVPVPIHSVIGAQSSTPTASSGAKYIYIDEALHLFSLSAAMEQRVAKESPLPSLWSASAGFSLESGLAGEASGVSKGILGFGRDAQGAQKFIAPPLPVASILRGIGKQTARCVELALCTLKTHPRLSGEQEAREVILQTQPKSKSMDEVEWVVGSRTRYRYLIMVVDGKMPIPQVGEVFEGLKATVFGSVLF